MELTHFKSIADLFRAFPDEQSCINHLTKIKWNGNVISPFDPNSQVYVCKNNKYKCRNTNRYFNVRSGTIFEDSKIPLQKWFLALYVFSSHKKGISSIQLSKDIDVTQKTAWFMLHRLRYAFEHPTFHADKLEGEIEVDETFIGGEAANKHESKKLKNEHGNTLHLKQPVIGMRERGGKVIAKVIPNTTSVQLLAAIGDNVKYRSIIYTDENSSYHSLNWQYNHQTVNHSAKQYVNGMAHTNGIENFWSHLKRGIDGIYHSISVKHLQSYIEEFTLRFNTRDLTTSGRFNLVLSNMTRRLKYQTLIAK